LRARVVRAPVDDGRRQLGAKNAAPIIRPGRALRVVGALVRARPAVEVAVDREVERVS
jgi:hypothetical protein